jgi:uncharacterized protein
MALKIRHSRIHGTGVYITRRIKAGTRVIEYTGRRISKEEADRMEETEHTVLFGLSDGKTIINGRGPAAFINHSCDPNCETDEINGRVWIYAARDIAQGEELSYDYNLYDGDGEAPCRCGAPNCRGTLYEPGKEPQVRKRRRDAKVARRKKTKRGAKGRRKR